ncbi:MAG: hypothetical protein HY231_14395 [Acidobacteria bacterium]|nr:hypothetical protein [Acidobacteriota bacterium]
MRKRFGIAGLTLALLLNTSFASKQKYRNREGVDGTILMGQHYAFILKEPNGWNLDTSSRKSNGLDAVLYTEGSSWKDAIAVMYVRVVYKDQKRKTVEQIINDDIKEFKSASKNSTVSPMPFTTTRDKKKAITRYCYDDEYKNYESVAYIDEPSGVVIIVLTSRNKEEYSKSLPAFKDLVASYFFVNELVNVK